MGSPVPRSSAAPTGPRSRLRAAGILLLALAGLPPASLAHAAPPGDPATSGPVLGWATRRAAELTAEARRLAASGARVDALVRLREALSMDATYGPAYLELASAREADGDPREAEQVLSMALERLPDFAEALEQRARLRSRRGDRGGAAVDLELALDGRPLDFDLHERVVGGWLRAGMMPRALAAARRWWATADAAGDPSATHRAALHATALARVVDRADPVSWTEGRGGVRDLLARAAREPRPLSRRTSR